MLLMKSLRHCNAGYSYMIQLIIVAYQLLLILLCFITACPLGTFGQDCLTVCHCADGAGCNAVTGKCPVGCEVDWSGESCSTETGTAGNTVL